MEKWVGIGQAGPSVQNEQIWEHQGQVFSDASFAWVMLTEEYFYQTILNYILFLYIIIIFTYYTIWAQ